MAIKLFSLEIFSSFSIVFVIGCVLLSRNIKFLKIRQVQLLAEPDGDCISKLLFLPFHGWQANSDVFNTPEKPRDRLKPEEKIIRRTCRSHLSEQLASF